MADKTTGLKLVQIRLVPDRTLLSDTPIDNQWKCIEVMKDFYRDLDREAILVVNVDAKCHPINCSVANLGTLTYCITDARELFKSAILSNAASVIMFHNHLSGDPSPSSEDIELTRRMAAAGAILGINVLDHIIVAGDNYCSLRGRCPEIFNVRFERGTYEKITDLLISNREKGR